MLGFKNTSLFFSALILLSNGLIPTRAAGASPPAAATYLVRSTSRPIYYTEWAQTTVTSTTTGEKVPDPNNFTFMCPGQSFLIGMASKFGTTANTSVSTASGAGTPVSQGIGVRHFRFACGFFENAAGKLASKTVANCDAKGFDNTYSNPGSSKCTPDKFIGGFNAVYDPAGRDSQYKAACCPVDSPDQTKIASDSCSAPKTLNVSGGDANMLLCDGDTAIQAVASSWQTQGTQSDRVITFTCCKLAAH